MKEELQNTLEELVDKLGTRRKNLSLRILYV
jgi:hypothetical protein